MGPLSPLDEHVLNRLAAAIAERHSLKKSPRERWIDRAVTWVVGILLAWGALQVDVAVLRQRVNTHDELLREMRDDIKTLLRRTP